MRPRAPQVESYEDEAIGFMTTNDKKVLWLSELVLQPVIVYGGSRTPSSADEQRLHHEAHERCYISNSIKSAVTVRHPDHS